MDGMKKRDERRSFIGLRKITLRRLLAAIEITVMLIELSITPSSPFVSVYANAMEPDAVIEASSASAEEPAQEGTSSGSEETGGEESGSAGDGQQESGQSGETGDTGSQEGGTGAGESSSVEEAAGGESKQDEAATSESVEPEKQEEPAAEASSAEEKKEDTASGESSVEEKKEDAAAAASSEEEKKEDAATGASSKEDKKEDAATGASSKDEKKDKATAGLSLEEKKEEEREIAEGGLSADDSVWLSFDKDAEIPEGSELRMEEISDGNDNYESFVNTAMENSGLASDQIAGFKVLDLSIMKDDEKIEPKSSVDVEINAAYLFGEGALYADDNVTVVHISGDDAEVIGAEVISGEENDGSSEDGETHEAFTRKGDAVRFSTGSFSAFVFIQSVSEKTVTATDGSYEITAVYDNVSGIPAGTELTVNEKSSDGDEMAGYYEASAGLFDEEIYSVEAIRAFDISFVDRESGDTYQPEKDVSFSIKLLDNGLLEGAEVNLIRFDGGAEIVDAGIDKDEQTLSFTTGSMTVYGVTQLAVKRELTASDGSTYSVTVGFDSVSGIPEDAVLSVSEILEDNDSYSEYVEKSSEEVEDVPGTVKVARAFDISFVNPNTGEVYEPTKPIQLSIQLLDEDIDDCESLDVVHIHGDNEEQTDLMDTTVNEEGSVEFEAESFSVYVFVKTVKAKTLVASDGEEYRITVTYDADAGIPAKAELVVGEILEGNEKYQEYMEKNAEALESKPEYFAMARAFDIKLVDPDTGEEYQPNKNVTVSIELLKDDLADYLDINVVHIPESEEAEVIESSIDEGTVEFATDGFSVYVLTGTTYLGIYHFFAYNSFGDYVTYHFTDDQGNQVDKQIIKNGERLMPPQDAPVNPNDPAAEFLGWYIGDGTAIPDFGPNPQLFNFNEPQSLIGPDKIQEIYLYAVFSKHAHITFHGKYDSVTQKDPVLNVRRVELTSGTATIDVTDVKAPDFSVVTSGVKHNYKFWGWGITSNHTPGQGDVIDNPDAYVISGDTNLYPVFREVHYLKLNTGPSGSGANYYSPVPITLGGTLDEATIKSSYIPQRPGFTFAGWYYNDNGNPIQITLADGTICAITTPIATIQTNTESKIVQISTDVTLDAKWTANNVDYKIVVWKQRTKNDADNWDYSESYVLSHDPLNPADPSKPYEVTLDNKYTTLDVLADYNSAHSGETPVAVSPYNDYTFNAAKTGSLTKEIATDGTTVFNLYYDYKNSATGGVQGNYALKFEIPDNKPDGTPSPIPEDYNNPTVQSGKTFAEIKQDDPTLPVVITGEVITPVIPATITGYEYSFFADPGHTTRLFFDQTSYDNYTNGNKVLYTVMPCSDLTVYCGWEKIWYLIKIDPNYGSLNGNGSTYFWKTYESDYIQEYTWVTRDYVESESGTYYYVNHDYEYSLAHPGEQDRTTSYDTDISKATSLTTYEQTANSPYVYDGWYQVNDDGSETPYTFGEPIRSNITLKLHWRIAGTYYLQYNTDVTIDGVRLKGRMSDDSILPDPAGYQDQANILIGGRAEAPDEYTFVGWTIRGDESGKIYYPGDTFKLLAKWGVTVNGEKTVYLDAVYSQIKTAKIIYDANGGQIADGANAGYPCDANGDRIPTAQSSVKWDTTKGTVTLYGLVNNSQVRLSDGTGFSAPATAASVATLSGWNTKADCTGDHYDLDSFKKGNLPIYVDINEPITLYAEWRVNVYFNKNEDNYPYASLGNDWGDGYTLVNGEYQTYGYVGATLREPTGTVSSGVAGLNFDFWSKTKTGDQSQAFNFGKETLTTERRLYARFTDAKKIPFHATTINKVDRDEWKDTNTLRVTTTALNLTLPASVSAYATPKPEGEYTYSYACLSDSFANVNVANQINTIQQVSDKVVVNLTNGTVIPDLEADGREIYLVYSINDAGATLNIRYIKEGISGAMSSVGDPIKYNGNPFTFLNAALLTNNILNSTTVSDTQVLTLSANPLEISQTVSDEVFNAPPLLDDGTDQSSLVYDSFGVITAATAPVPLNKQDIDVSDKKLYLRYYDGRRQWSKDNSTWTTFNGDTLYVIYRPKGYELTVTKAVLPANSGISEDESFEVTITSTSITRDSYNVEGTGYSTIAATPATASTPAGNIKLTVKDGSEIKIKGLASGSYNISETPNSNYTTKVRESSSTSYPTYTTANDITIPNLSTNTTVDFSNEAHIICRILHESAGVDKPFYTLKSALDYAGNSMDGDAKIEMVCDYVMPEWDVLDIPATYSNIILTSRGGPFTITRNPNQSTDEPMFTNRGKLTLSSITLNGSSVSRKSSMVWNEGTLIVGNNANLINAKKDGDNGAAIYQNKGTLTVNSGANFTGNSANDGGAIYVKDGIVNISGGTFSGNNAIQNGGAIYYDGSSTVTISGGSFTGNNSAIDGGAIYAKSGNITNSNGSFTGNTSARNGGAIYSDTGTVNITGGTVSGNTAATNGGGIYSGTGSVIISGGTIDNNVATGGNGGAVCSAGGTVRISGGTLNSNTATGGTGGAVYIGTGSLDMSNGTIGVNGANSAINGSGVIVGTGTGTFTGGSITGNTATTGGAIGVADVTTRLYFSGTISVTGNKMGTADSNSYLDKDVSDVINIKGLSTGAALGVYVPDSIAATRGVPGAKFATYTNATNKDLITNDRNPSFSVVSEDSTKKLYWGKAISIEVRYQSGSFATKGFPPADTGYSVKMTKNDYYPVMDNAGYVAISALAEDLIKNYGLNVGSATAVYGGAWVDTVSLTYDEYVTKLIWDSTNNEWKLVKHDDTTRVSLGNNKLLVYFAEPAYINIENNTEMRLTITELKLTVGAGVERSVINTATAAGYGMLYAKNGALRSALLPVESADLILNSDKSVNLLIPGGKGLDYTLSGSFTGYTGEVPDFRRTEYVGGKYVLTPFALTVAPNGTFTAPAGGKTRNDSSIHQIIFGKDKEICRIRTPLIAAADTGDNYLKRTETPDGDGNIEYVFKSLNQAMTFVTTFMSGSKTATIEMLTDYLLPASDNVVIPQGYDITFTTAEGGWYHYPSETTGSTRATISRDSENKDSMIKSWNNAVSGRAGTKLTINNLIFDGKSISGDSDGGVVSSLHTNVYVDNVDFKNSFSQNGGALLVMHIGKGKNPMDTVPDTILEVKDSHFYNCVSTAGVSNRLGGGAIVTNAVTMTLDNCIFDSCIAADQAGAVFHRIDKNLDSYGNITNCTFTNCRAAAAGGLELDSKFITVKGCTFDNCVATTRNGGGFNAFMTNNANPEKSVGCRIIVEDCNFNDCHTTNYTGDNYGGAFRSTSVYTVVINCTFNNTTGRRGGAIAVSNNSAEKLEIYGCSINGGVANEFGGGVFCKAQELIISDAYNVDANGNLIVAESTEAVDHSVRAGDMIIHNCTSTKAGGGIYHTKDSNALTTSLEVTNATIQNNITNTESGGGIYSTAKNITITGSTIASNTAKTRGGGIHAFANNDSYMLIIDSTNISDNRAGASGGGVYSSTQVTIRNNTSITGNRLTDSASDATEAAGVYMNRLLTIGTTGATTPDKILIMDNSTASGAASDLLLVKDNNTTKIHKKYSVHVLCSLHDESVIRVINPRGIGEQFGTRDDESFTGFTEGVHAFVSDSGALYGVYDRNTPGNVIWRGGAVCKLTDANGHMLYLDQACTDPAVFDRLDYRTNGSKLSPFSYLRQTNENVKLYKKAGAGSSELIDLTSEEIQIKMLVSTFETDTYITTDAHSDRKLLTLTTASSTDSDGYPYTGRAGSYATIIRKYTDNSKSLINTGINLTLKNITLDGGSTDKTSPKTTTASGGLIYAATNGTTVTLMANSVLQNCTISNGNSGAGIFADKGASLIISGGAIYNCITASGNGGGVYKSGDAGKLEFSSGIISRCSAKNGGGVYFVKGTSGITMSGSAQITGCTAEENGGGVWLNEQKTMNMTGGAITANKAGIGGGGIYLVYHKNSRLNLSGRVMVSGNTFISDGKACNVQLGTADNNPSNANDWNGVINSLGIARNSYIGIYVPGVETANKNTSVFDKHGLKSKPFGKYTSDTNYLYCFINDRNGLKGGLQTGDPTYIHWVEIFSITVSKTVISGEQSDLEEDFSFKVTISRQQNAETPDYDFNSTDANQCYFTYDGDYPGKTDAGGNPKRISIEHGVATFTLRTGESITVNNLPAEIDYQSVYYKVEEQLSPERKNHYTVSTTRSTNPGNANQYYVKGRVAENLDKEIESKYVSNAFFDNINGICKLTSSKNGGVLLYTWDTASGKLVPAVYSCLRGNNTTTGAFDVINNAGTSSGRTLYYWNAFSNKYETYDFSSDDVIRAEMLIGEYTLKTGEAVTLESGKAVTFTTADPNATDGFPYVGSGTTAKIIRGTTSSGGPGVDEYMFTAKGALTLKNICLDGNNLSVNKGIVTVPNSSGSLTIEENTTIQNSTLTGNNPTNGGAIYVNGGKLTMNGGTIKNNSTKKFGGGAIRIEGNGNVTISGGEISNNTVDNVDANGGAISVKLGTLTIKGGTIKDNKVTGPNTYANNAQKVGGAIYAEQNSKIYLSGGTIAHNTLEGYGIEGKKGGAGIYLATDADANKRPVLYISGNPIFGEGANANTLEISGYAEKKNGTESAYTGNIVRQDIYIAETVDKPAAMVVNGDLTGAEGSIWVWTVSDKHYKTITPFAAFGTGVVYAKQPAAGQYSSGHLKVFRNAQDDETTQNPKSQTPKYLYGILNPSDADYVYWYGVEGKARVMLVKVQDQGSSYKALSGKTFTVYTNSTMTDIAKGKVLNSTTGAEEELQLQNLASGAGGAFFIGELSNGTYYIKENGATGHFEIRIENDGVVDPADTTKELKIVTLQ
ncbi:MAG: hypothetical protein IJU77_04515 [Butyrivibrio sp.]|nr:hypothetical protein [Butyrivibrio sp.]